MSTRPKLFSDRSWAPLNPRETVDHRPRPILKPAYRIRCKHQRASDRSSECLILRRAFERVLSFRRTPGPLEVIFRDELHPCFFERHLNLPNHGGDLPKPNTRVNQRHGMRLAKNSLRISPHNPL